MPCPEKHTERDSRALFVSLAPGLLSCLFQACSGEFGPWPNGDDMETPDDAEVEAPSPYVSGDAPGADAASDEARADPLPPPPELRIMTYNMKHAEDSDLETIAQVILAESPDIVGLQEVDKEAARSEGEFQSYRLGQLTGMASIFSAALNFPEGGQYGLALLSKLPILSSEKLSLTSLAEQRILVIVDVELPSGEVVPVAVTHLGTDADERLVQAGEVQSALDGLDRCILMGDLNDTPDGAAYETLTAMLADAWPLAGSGDGTTYPSDVPVRRIDYIMTCRGWQPPDDARVPETMASDHRPVVASLVLPPVVAGP